MSQREHYDVIIVGAGVAGGAAARFLTRFGRRTLVIEATDWPRHRETCSGIFGQTFDLLDTSVADYPGEIFEMAVDDIRLVFGGRAYGAFPERWVKPFYDETLYLTLRGELEAWILGLSSAELVTGCHLRPSDIAQEGLRYRVTLGDERVVESDFLIGAGGTHCPVRRRFFEEDRNRDDMVVLLESELEGELHGGLLSNYYYFDGVRGFAWVYPKGDGGRLTNIGVCAVGDPRDARIRPHWEAFVDHLKRERILDRDYDPGRAVGSALYLAQLDGPVTTRDGRCLIVGDAAGVTHRDFWNGITPSIQSGRLAADHIAGRGAYRRPGLDPFLFRFGRRGLRVKAKVVDLVFREALPRVSRYLEKRRQSGR